MKKISNWSILGYAGAIVYAGVDIWQYWITYPDTSQFMMNAAIAALIAGVSWLFNKTLSQGYTITAMEEYLQDKSK